MITPQECYQAWRKRALEKLDILYPNKPYKRVRTRIEDLDSYHKESDYRKGCSIYEGIVRDLQKFDRGLFGYKRSADQQTIHKKSLQVCLPVIFKNKSWVYNANQIERKYGVRCSKRGLGGNNGSSIW